VKFEKHGAAVSSRACWMFGYIYRETSGSKLAKSSNTFHFYWPSGFLSLDSAFLLFEAQQFVAESYLG
jgi:hypothetical protein